MHPTFSFIIINFRSAHLLPEWFASLPTTRLSPDEYEVIVVNNDAHEREALDNLKQHYAFTLIHTENNLGFGAACNRGAAIAQGETLGFINPDSRFLEGALHIVRDRFRNDPSLGIIGLKLVTPDGSIQEWSAGTRITLWDIVRNNLGFPASKKIWLSPTPTAAHWVSGASLFIPRELFSEIGGFDENFFLYFEDVDLCERIRKHHKKILYFPEVAVRHLSGQSASSRADQKKHYYASQDRFFAKHRPKWEGLCIRLLRSALRITTIRQRTIE